MEVHQTEAETETKGQRQTETNPKPNSRMEKQNVLRPRQVENRLEGLIKMPYMREWKSLSLSGHSPRHTIDMAIPIRPPPSPHHPQTAISFFDRSK